MKTELEKKLNKLPNSITDIDNSDAIYDLNIYKNITNAWVIQYVEFSIGNALIRVIHNSLQAAVDTTLKEIKNL